MRRRGGNLTRFGSFSRLTEVQEYQNSSEGCKHKTGKRKSIRERENISDVANEKFGIIIKEGKNRLVQHPLSRHAFMNVITKSLQQGSNI